MVIVEVEATNSQEISTVVVGASALSSSDDVIIQEPHEYLLLIPHHNQIMNPMIPHQPEMPPKCKMLHGTVPMTKQLLIID